MDFKHDRRRKTIVCPTLRQTSASDVYQSVESLPNRRPPACATLHFRRPAQVPQQIGAMRPHENPELLIADALRMQAPVRLHTPAQIGTAPRTKPVPTGEPPQKADRSHFPLAARFSGLSGVA